MSYIPKCVDYIFFKKNKSPVIILYSKAQHSKTLIILHHQKHSLYSHV